MTCTLEFCEIKENKEYAVLDAGVQVFSVKRNPQDWRAFDMAGHKVLKSDQYRYDLFDRLELHYRSLQAAAII